MAASPSTSDLSTMQLSGRLRALYEQFRERETLCHLWKTGSISEWHLRFGVHWEEAREVLRLVNAAGLTVTFESRFILGVTDEHAEPGTVARASVLTVDGQPVQTMALIWAKAFLHESTRLDDPDTVAELEMAARVAPGDRDLTSVEQLFHRLRGEGAFGAPLLPASELEEVLGCLIADVLPSAESSYWSPELLRQHRTLIRTATALCGKL